MKIMKLKDLMLDLATGDASSHDPYIAEAAGQVNVASAYFEAASKINELVENNELQVVQEVAAAGLPTDATGSSAVACTGVKKGVIGLFEVIHKTAEKVKAQSEKDMKILLTIGKKYGVSAPSAKDNFATDFAAPLAKAIFSKTQDGKKIELPEFQFLKGKYADKIAKNYAKGMCSLIHAYGYDISEVFNDPVVGKYLNKSYAKKGECSSLTCAAEALSDGAKLIKFETISKDKHYTNSVKASDVEDVATDLYIIIAVSSAVADALKGENASAKANVNALFEECEGSSKIAKSVREIGDNMKEWTSDVQDITNTITKAFTDAVYSLSEAIK